MFSYLNFKRTFSRKRGWMGILPYVRRAYCRDIIAYFLTIWVERSNNWKCVCNHRLEISLQGDILTEDKLEYYCVSGTDGTFGSFNSKKINVCINNLKVHVITTACHSGKLKLAFTSPDVISTSPKSFLTSRIDFTVLICYSNSSKDITCLLGKLKTEFTGLIAKSTSPRLLDTPFFAR